MVDFAKHMKTKTPAPAPAPDTALDPALDPATLEAIDGLSAEYQLWSARATKAEQMRKELGAELQGVLEGLDAKSIASAIFKVTRVTKAGAWRLDEKKLLANGVDPEIIVASKSQDRPSEYVKVSRSAKGYTPEVVRRGVVLSGEGEGE